MDYITIKTEGSFDTASVASGSALLFLKNASGVFSLGVKDNTGAFHEVSNNDLEERTDTVEGTVSGLETSVSTLESSVSGLEQSVSDLENSGSAKKIYVRPNEYYVRFDLNYMPGYKKTDYYQDMEFVESIRSDPRMVAVRIDHIILQNTTAETLILDEYTDPVYASNLWVHIEKYSNVFSDKTAMITDYVDQYFKQYSTDVQVVSGDHVVGLKSMQGTTPIDVDLLAMMYGDTTPTGALYFIPDELNFKYQTCMDFYTGIYQGLEVAVSYAYKTVEVNS